MDTTTPDGQRRAKVGGEIAPNGDFYKGGSFIATTDAPKGDARPARPIDPEADARARQNAAEFFARQSTRAAIRAARAPLIARLLSCPVGTHLHQIGETLNSGVSVLAGWQVAKVCDFILGRRTKATAAAWDALYAELDA